MDPESLWQWLVAYLEQSKLSPKPHRGQRGFSADGSLLGLGARRVDVRLTKFQWSACVEMIGDQVVAREMVEEALLDALADDEVTLLVYENYGLEPSARPPWLA